MEKKVTAFASGVRALGAATTRHPQSAYAGYTRSFSAEWMYLQRVVPGIGEAFVGVEERITSKLLPSLLGLTQIDKDLRKLATLTVKQGGWDCGILWSGRIKIGGHPVRYVHTWWSA